MRSLLLPLLLTFTCSGCASCMSPLFAAHVALDGIEEEERSVEAFQGVYVTQGIDALIWPDPGPGSLTVRMDEGKHDSVVTQVVNGTLTVKLRDGSGPLDAEVAVVIIRTPTLTSVEAAEGSEVEVINDFTAPFSLDFVRATGGGWLWVQHLDTQSLRAEVDTAGKLVLDGKAGTLDAHARGGGILWGPVSMERLDVDAAGGSQLEQLTATEVAGRITDGSTLDLDGQPSVVSVCTSGGGKVRYCEGESGAQTCNDASVAVCAP